MLSATWNVKAFRNKEQETLKGLNDNKIDICARSPIFYDDSSNFRN